MEKDQLIYKFCLSEKNLRAILEIIREKIRLEKTDLQKCVNFCQDFMKKSIARLSRQPKNQDELKKLIKYLNNSCISTIIESITRKHPHLFINQKKDVNKEHMKREIDVWGQRDNHVLDRSFNNNKKNYQQSSDDTQSDENINDIGYSGASDSAGYASAFGNHLITNIPVGQKQMIFNNTSGHRDSNEFDKRFEEMMKDRNNFGGQPQRPPTPDFTLDGSGEKVRQEKLLRKMQNMDAQSGNMPGMANLQMFGNMSAGMPSAMMGGMTSDDPYASLLGAGAPNTQFSQKPMIPPNTFMGNLNPMMQTSTTMMTGINPMTNMNPVSNINPMIPLSTGNLMAQQMGINNMNSAMGGFGAQSAKSQLLNNDYERKLAERNQIDIETGQPTTTNYNNNNNNFNTGSYSLPMNQLMYTNTNNPAMFNIQSQATGLTMPMMNYPTLT